MNGHTPPAPLDPLESAAWFVVGQPGWTERALAEHTRRDNRDCAGCGTYRSTKWPCALVYIANRAAEIARGLTPSSARTPRHIRVTSHPWVIPNAQAGAGPA